MGESKRVLSAIEIKEQIQRFHIPPPPPDRLAATDFIYTTFFLFDIQLFRHIAWVELTEMTRKQKQVIMRLNP